MKRKLLNSFVLVLICYTMTAQSEFNAKQICKSWVMDGYLAPGSTINYKIYNGIEDTTISFTVYLFKENGTVEPTEHYARIPIDWKTAKPCGNGDPYIESSSWYVKGHHLYWTIITGLRGEMQFYTTISKYKIVSVTDTQMALKLISSDSKSNLIPDPK